MNAKLAKRLRREARALTPGALHVQYRIAVRERGKRILLLAPACTRAVCQRLKAGYGK